MKAVFVNRFFHPDAAPTAVLASDVAFDWAAAGVEVHAIAGRGSYAHEGVAYAARERVGVVEVHRVATARSRRASLAARLLDYAGFHLLAGWRLWRLIRRGDIVVVKTDPPLMSVTAAIVALLRGARLVNWLQDLFPEVAERARIRALPRPLLATAGALRDWSLRRAHMNVAVGEGMARLVARRAGAVHVRTIPNWSRAHPGAPLHANESLRVEWGLAGKFVVGYSGNLGRAHDVDTLAAAAGRLAGREDIIFSFVGAGHGMARLKEAALPNVRTRGYVEEALLGASLSLADVHLVTLLPSFEGLMVPSKVYGIAAAARPIIFVGDREGEVACMLREHRCGVAVASGDDRGLAQAIAHLCDRPQDCREMGERARHAFDAHWDRPLALARWREVLENVRGEHYSGNPPAPVSP